MSMLTLKGIEFGSNDLNAYAPEKPDNFCIWLTLTIGPQEAEGGHLFQLGICTSTWLAHQVSRKNIYVLRHMFLVERFDIELIKNKIHKIIQDANRLGIKESIGVLCRYFQWEYEDFQANDE